jgi:serine/threonine protein phosphatase PrpC
LETEGSGASRAGEDDLRNEDAYLVEKGLGLYVVCDGSSHRPGGQVAANVAVEALEQFVARSQRQFGATLHREMASRSFASRAIRHALESVFEVASSDPEFEGMATTLTMLLAQGRHGVVGHVGDSRAYLVREARIQLLTVDHEWTEALNGGDSDLWARALDTFYVELRPQDTFLLCSDGAERVVEDPEIVRIAGSMSPWLLANRIVTVAQRNDAFQDATCVVVRVLGELESQWLSLSAIPRTTDFGHAITVAD